MSRVVLADHCACFVCPECMGAGGHRPGTCNACLSDVVLAFGGYTKAAVPCGVGAPVPDVGPDEVVPCIVVEGQRCTHMACQATEDQWRWEAQAICQRGWHDYPGGGVHLHLLNGRLTVWLDDSSEAEVSELVASG